MTARSINSSDEVRRIDGPMAPVLREMRVATILERGIASREFRAVDVDKFIADPVELVLSGLLQAPAKPQRPIRPIKSA